MKDKTFTKKELNNIYPINESCPVKIEIGKISDIKEIKINWLWKNVAAFGKITIFAGQPGVGKSSLLLYIANIVSKGDKFHFQADNCECGNVLIISAEDNADDTIKPRLMALGADLNKIHFVKGIKKEDKRKNTYYDAIDLVENISEIEDIIIEHKYKLIIVDPVVVYLGSIDDGKNKEIRSALAILQALAERHNIAILLNSHFNKPQKSGNSDAIYRIMGSVGFAAAPRIVYGIMRDLEDEEGKRRYFKCIKNNIGDDSIGYAYKMIGVSLNDGIETNKIEWLDEKVEMSANEILNYQIKSPKLDEAIDFLKDKLKFGSVSVSEIRTEAEKRSISVNRLYKAKKSLNVQEDSSFGGKRGKIWFL